MTPSLSVIMSVALFALGVTALAAGIWTILAREYQQALKGITAQSNRLNARSLTEIGERHVPVLEALRAGDPVLAEAEMRRHIEEPGDWIRDAVGAQPEESVTVPLTAVESGPIKRRKSAR